MLYILHCRECGGVTGFDPVWRIRSINKGEVQIGGKVLFESNPFHATHIDFIKNTNFSMLCVFGVWESQEKKWSKRLIRKSG